MDSRRFDAIVRRLTEPNSRRGALAGMVAFASVVASRPGSEAKSACRYPGMACRSDSACCKGSFCDEGQCRCDAKLVQCGDFCLSKKGASQQRCCKPYKSPCVYHDRIPCCGASICTGRLNDEWVCCGLDIHPCTPETADYCCSKHCTVTGRCAPVPPPSAR
ncbi:MAG: hypothetical protein ACR2J8_01980 [Thermomicrobiales bacterium]